MTFKELQIILNEKLGVTKLADIAREFSVTPQVVSNWKSRDQVPYKYVKILRDEILEMGTQKKKMSKTVANEEAYSINDNLDDQGYNEADDIIKALIDFYSKLKNNFILFLLPPLIIAFFSFTYFRYFEMPIFKSHCTIIPISSAGKKNSASGLASQFGIKIGGNTELSGMSDAAMFPDIIRSRRLAEEIINENFNSIRFGNNQSLIRILNYEVDEVPEVWSDSKKNKAIKRLMKMIDLRLSKTSPMITIVINSNEPGLSADIANTLVKSLNNLLDHFKLSQVKEQKAFIQNRIIEVEKDLIIAEENLKQFREQNRNILGSPALLLNQERLRRELEVQNQIYYTIKSQYETVQIEEIGNKSMLQILDDAQPGMKVYPNTIRLTIKYMLFGFFITAFVIFGKDWYSKNRLKFIFH